MAREIWKPGNMLYPIPPVMVSCAREGEKPNIVTVAWAGNICSSPAMLSISVRPERYSYDIIKETGEFVVNLTNRSTVKAADWCGVRSGRDYDKFKEMNLTPLKSNKISAPGIEECPVNIECKVKQIIPLGSHDMFIAEVLCVNVDDSYMDEKGRFNMRKADLVAYSHGEYFELGDKLGKFGYSVVKKNKVKLQKELATNTDKKAKNSKSNKKVKKIKKQVKK
ncbi:MAG: flavin reductase family protein [Butyrivibrio sp.]|nr:flavin reductase family protein [Butyrivibrio sp.]